MFYQGKPVTDLFMVDTDNTAFPEDTDSILNNRYYYRVPNDPLNTTSPSGLQDIMDVVSKSCGWTSGHNDRVIFVIEVDGDLIHLIDALALTN